VLAAYLAIAEREPERVIKVEAKEAIPKVHKRIVELVEQRMAASLGTAAR